VSSIKYLALFIFLIVVYFVWRSEDKKGVAVFFSVLLGPLVTGIILIIILGLMSCIFPHQEYLVRKNPIYGVSSSSQTQGSFFLGTGKVNNADYYYFFEESSRGKQLQKSRARSTYIKEYGINDKYNIPEKRVYGFEYQNDFLRKNGFPTMLDPYVVLYVPSGTIVTEYNIDLRDF